MSRTLACLLSSLMFCGAAQAETVSAFYTGKTINIIAGMSPPDQHDNDARLLSRHMGKYIPGSPAIVVQNMPGAGGLKAVQFLATVAPRDGTTFGISQRGTMMMTLLRFPEANFDPRRFTWIGTRAGETSIVALWHKVPVNSIDDVRTRETIVASTGGGADSNTLPFIYNETLGTRFKPVTGYSSGGDMNLAMERGEVDGRVGWSVGAMRGTKEDWYRGKLVKIILQHGLKHNRELGSTPLAQELAKNDDDRKLLELFAARQEIGFPVFGPPSIPADRAEALRAAYDKTMKDPEYIAEVAKMNVELAPYSGAEMQSLIERIYATPAPVVERARAILLRAGAIPK
ncbi:MAG: Bug family tripartite tricarboxylate transporter substrate binding protein [Beijerinckiaceae bacterium]